MVTSEYAPGRLADLLGDPRHPAVLLWHGMQSDARTAVRPLAETIACHRVAVVVPDWNSHAADGGRADLLASVDFARLAVAHPEGLVLVGWSMGGLAAAGLTVHSATVGVAVAHTVCLAGAFMAEDPISGERLPHDLAHDGASSAFTLLHGGSDDVVPIAASRDFAATLQRGGWAVELVELDADHGSIAGARYDPGADRYLPANDTRTRSVVQDVAARIAAVTGR
jgi:dipeptidyl aminopeptidase/acylaminoacyl peptidase